MRARRSSRVQTLGLSIALVLVLLTGCLDRQSEVSDERLHVEIRSMPGSAQWDVGIPVPISTPGTSVDDWFTNMTVGGFAQVVVVETVHGPVLRVTGLGTAILESHAKQGPMIGNLCCAEAFLDARWSAGERNMSQVRLATWGGAAVVEIAYHAESSSCDREDTVSGKLRFTGEVGSTAQWVWLPAALGASCE